MTLPWVGTIRRVPTSDYSVIFGTVVPSSPTTHYTKVDEYPSTDDTDYCQANSGEYLTLFPDEFGFTAFDVPAGSIITNVTVYLRGQSPATNSKLGALIVVNGTAYTDHTHNFPASPPGGIQENTYTWATNPDTPGVAWTVADVNGSGAHSLQYFGYDFQYLPESWGKAMRVYIEANYTLGPRSYILY